MNRRKLFAAAIVLALVMLIGSILAYFTDTDTATNKFTLGDQIEISVVESGGWVKNAQTGIWENSNAEGIHPGAVVNKAPSIHNDSTTTSAYVFAEVIVPCYASTGTTADTPLFTLNNIGADWVKISSNETVNTGNKTITYIYAYATAAAGPMTQLAANSTTTTPVFSTVTLAPTLTAEQKATAPANPNIVVNGYGIQKDGLGSADPMTIYGMTH